MKKILILLLFVNFGNLYAQDRLFTYTYQSTVLNKSQKEIEIWTTLKNGRSNFFRGLKHRMEFEVGLGGNLQTSFYLNYDYSKGIVENNGIQSVENNSGYSFSNEWKYKLTDPVANAFGSALYFEYTLSPSETGLEAKLIFDKQIGRTVQAFNIVGEYVFVKEFQSVGNKIEAETFKEKNLEFNYAIACKVKDGLSLGLEVFNQNQFSNTNEWENSVLSAGPTMSYNMNGYWLNLTFMPQITNFKGSIRES
jgi:hypothetical protein